MAVLFTVVYVASQQIWDDRAARWDAEKYVAMSGQIASGEPLSGPGPFVYRIGFPALAAFISPQDPVSGMRLISIASGLLSILLMWLWLSKFQMASPVRLALVALFAMQYHGPLRFGVFFSPLTYSMFWVFLLLGLVLLRHAATRRHVPPILTLGVLATCFVGTLVRETMVIVPLSMLLIQAQPDADARTRHLRIVMGALGSCLVAIAITHALARQTGDYAFVSTALGWIETKSALELVAGLFLTFGPMLAVLVCSPRQTFRFLESHKELAALIALASALAVVGGTNTEIFWYWAAPAVLAAVGVVLTQRSRILLQPLPALLLLAAQLLSERAFWSIPLEVESPGLPPVIFTPLTGSAYLQIWSHFGPGAVLRMVVLSNLAFVGGYALLAKSLQGRIDRRCAVGS